MWKLSCSGRGENFPGAKPRIITLFNRHALHYSTVVYTRPHVRTTDEELRSLVQDDLKNPANFADILKLADRWWERAESSSALSQEGMRRRATHWYRLIPPGKLQGLDAQKVAKRIAEAETDWLANWRPYSPAATFAKQVVGRYRLTAYVQRRSTAFSARRTHRSMQAAAFSERQCHIRTVSQRIESRQAGSR